MIDRNALPQGEATPLFMLRAALNEFEPKKRLRYLVAALVAIALDFGVDVFASAITAAAGKLLDP